jgi:hypothetical protein
VQDHSHGDEDSAQPQHADRRVDEQHGIAQEVMPAQHHGELGVDLGQPLLVYGRNRAEQFSARPGPDLEPFACHHPHAVVDGAVSNQQAVAQQPAGRQQHDRRNHGRDRVDGIQTHPLVLPAVPVGQSSAYPRRAGCASPAGGERLITRIG